MAEQENEMNASVQGRGDGTPGTERNPVRMVKKTAVGKGAAPVGEQVYVFLPSRLGGEWSETEARHRAWRIFGRDRPDENPMDWETLDA